MEYKEYKEYKECKTIASSCTFVLSLLLLLLLSPLTSFAQSVVFSHPGGFYSDTFSLSMHIGFFPNTTQSLSRSVTQPLTIHYTLNGAEPTVCDAQYTAPLPLSADCYSRSDFFRVPTVPADRWFVPDSVEHIIVVRAAAFDSTGERCSPVTTQSYLINSLFGRRISLPVVSLCADSLSLFDFDTGLFVPGWYHDPRYAYNTGNYFQKGRHWERQAAFAYYEPEGGSLEQDCGLRVHGNSQRVLAQKGMSLYARSEYGDSRFRYPFFTHSPFTIHHSSLDSYRRLVLRPWSASWSSVGIEDWLCQRLAEPLRCDHLATRPVVLFVNGEYWGIYFLEEKADEHYVEEHHGVRDEEVDLLAYWGNEVENGSRRRWNDFVAWLENADTRRQEDYDRLAAQVDIDAVMDYMLMQVLILNDDWPVSNVRFWSSDSTKWRWIFYDADGALASFPDNAVILDYMTYRNQKTTTHTSPQATLLFRRLYNNRQFLEGSFQRLRELVATHFAYRNTAPLLHDIVRQVENEVPYQIRRFDSPSSMVRWRMALSVIDDFLRTEPEAMVNEYALYFGLAKPASRPTFAVYDRYGRQLLPPGSSEEQLQGLPQGMFFLRYADGTIVKQSNNQ